MSSIDVRFRRVINDDALWNCGNLAALGAGMIGSDRQRDFPSYAELRITGATSPEVDVDLRTEVANRIGVPVEIET